MTIHTHPAITTDYSIPGSVAYIIPALIVTALAPLVCALNIICIAGSSVEVGIYALCGRLTEVEIEEYKGYVFDCLVTIIKAIVITALPLLGIVIVARLVKNDDIKETGMRGLAESLAYDIGKNRLLNAGLFEGMINKGLFLLSGVTVSEFKNNSGVDYASYQAANVKHKVILDVDRKVKVTKLTIYEFISNPENPYIIYFSGNNSLPLLSIPLAEQLLGRNYNCILASYGGYPDNEGDGVTTSEKTVKEDVTAIVNYLKSKNVGQVGVVGNSVGSIPATIAADENGDLVNSVSLFVPFDTVTDLSANATSNGGLPGSIIRGFIRAVIDSKQKDFPNYGNNGKRLRNFALGKINKKFPVNIYIAGAKSDVIMGRNFQQGIGQDNFATDLLESLKLFPQDNIKGEMYDGDHNFTMNYNFINYL